MKKTLCYLLVLTILLTLSACGGKQGDTSSTPVEEALTTVTTASTTTTTTAKPTTTTTVKPTNKTKKTTSRVYNTVPRTTVTKFEDTPIPAFDGTLTVYFMNIDSTAAFIENPSFFWVKNDPEYAECVRITKPTEKGYVNYRGLQEKIFSRQIELVGNKAILEEKLSELGVSEEPMGAVYIAANRIIPRTMWVKTKENDYFVVDETTSAHELKLQLYTQSQYHKKYGLREGQLTILEKDITGAAPMNLYNNYAELPMLAILQALDATVQKKSDTIYTIKCNKQTYVLDIDKKTLVEKGDNSQNNLLFYEMVFSRIYPVEGEIMASDITVSTMLNNMGMDLDVEIDMKMSKVSIVPAIHIIVGS